MDLENGDEKGAQKEEEPWQTVTTGNKKAKLSDRSPVAAVEINNRKEI